jgi:hypothetical protein
LLKRNDERRRFTEQRKLAAIMFKMIMAADATKEIQFEIGHVLFIDIVGYSKLRINQQSEILRELNEIVSGTAVP